MTIASSINQANNAVGSRVFPSWSAPALVFAVAVAIILLHAIGILPSWLDRLPDQAIPPTAEVLDVVFVFVQNDLGIIHLTRGFAALLEYPLDFSANLLYGKNAFPYLGRFLGRPWPRAWRSWGMLWAVGG